jgi:hypothetical protein
MIATSDATKITRVGRACQEDGTSAEYFLFKPLDFHPPVESSRVPIHIDRRILGLTLCSDRSGVGLLGG